MQSQLGETLLATSRRLARRHSARLGTAVAQDLASEAMLRVLQTPPPDGRFAPWMERIFHNLIVDAWRSKKPETAVDTASLASSDPTAEDHILTQERVCRLHESLAKLPPELEQAVTLRYFEGQNETLASLRLGVAAPTVRTRIHRALARMRGALSGLRVLWPPSYGPWLIQSMQATLVPVMPVLLSTVLGVGVLSSTLPPAPETGTYVSRSFSSHLVRNPRSTGLGSPSELLRATPIPAGEHGKLWAQARPVPPKARPPIVYNFQDDEVVGDLQRPDSLDIFAGPAKAPQASLIEIPNNFIPAFQKMIEDLL